MQKILKILFKVEYKYIKTNIYTISNLVRIIVSFCHSMKNNKTYLTKRPVVHCLGETRQGVDLRYLPEVCAGHL